MEQQFDRTEEGHYLSEEDWLFNAKWKIAQLIKEGWSVKAIIKFVDGEEWRLLCENIYKEII